MNISLERWLNLNNLENEEWKRILNFEDKYLISNYGRVKSIIFNTKILRPRIDKKGYIHYALKKNGKTKEMKAHRLVALHFIPNFYNKLQVNHIDGNKQNNNANNLEWCTNGENQKHSYIIKPNRGNVFRDNNPNKKRK